MGPPPGPRALFVAISDMLKRLGFQLAANHRHPMVTIRYTGDALWERIERAVEKVKDRMLRVAQALNAADIPYAVIGGNAVQVWVAQVDEAAVRNTQDVDILLDRDSLDRAITALQPVGFIFQEVAGVSMFLDGPDASPRDAVHIVFAEEKVRSAYHEPAPSTDRYEMIKQVRTLRLESLVEMKLTSYRRKDQVHLLDMIDVGLINDSWTPKFSPELASRLQELIDDPDG